jgi:hypothetical protein
MAYNEKGLAFVGGIEPRQHTTKAQYLFKSLKLNTNAK